MQNRRQFIRIGSAATVPFLISGCIAGRGLVRGSFEEATILDLQNAMNERRVNAASLVEYYLDRIVRVDKTGPSLNSVIELNPDARDIARQLDVERRTQGSRGPLHGIPVLLKDNIDTHDRMMTTAGSMALVGSIPSQDSTVARKLREAGAVILGKTNLSEWANFRGNLKRHCF